MSPNGARKEHGLRAMMLSTAFVAGIAALFVPLGLAAGTPVPADDLDPATPLPSYLR